MNSVELGTRPLLKTYTCITCMCSIFTYFLLNPLRPKGDKGRSLLLLSFATIFNSPQVFPTCERSLLQVFFGLPLFLFPWGFHSRAWRVTLVFFFLNVWPIHLHFLVVMVCMTGSFLVIFHRFLLLIFSGHLWCFLGTC